MVPVRERAARFPVARIVEAQEGAALRAGVVLKPLGLGGEHVGAETAKPHAARLARLIGDKRTEG